MSNKKSMKYRFSVSPRFMLKYDNHKHVIQCLSVKNSKERHNDKKNKKRTFIINKPRNVFYWEYLLIFSILYR